MATRSAAAAHSDAATELRRIRRRLQDALLAIERDDLTVIDLREIDAEADRLAALTRDVIERLDEAWEEIG